MVSSVPTRRVTRLSRQPPELRSLWPARAHVVLCLIVLVAAVKVAAAPADIEAARATLARAALEDAQRQAAVANLDAAAEAERAVEANTARMADLRNQSAGLPARAAQLDKSLAVDRDRAVEDWLRRLPRNADGETLERLLEQERRALNELQAQIDATGTELALELSRPMQAPGEVAALRRTIEELALPIAPVEGEPAAVLESRRLRRVSEQRRAQAELEVRLAEQDTAFQRQRMYELVMRESRHRMGMHQSRIEHLQQRIADRGREELEARRARLAEQAEQLASAPRIVSLAAAENLALGDELLDNHERLARERTALASIEEERDYVTETLRDSRTRIELGGTNERVGRWLWSERRRLAPPARLREQLEQTRVALADLRLRLFALSDQQRGLADIPAAVRALEESSRTSSDDEEVEQAGGVALTPLLRERQELLALLRPLLERRIAALAQGERTLDEQLAATVTLQRLLDRHLLWLPSHGPVDRDWLARVPDGLHDLLKTARWRTTLDLSLRHFEAEPWRWLGSLAVLGVLVGLRRRAPARITAEAAVTKDVRHDSYAATVRAGLWTLLAALPIPVAVALLGHLLQQVGSAGRFSDSLGQALGTLVLPLFAVQVLRWSVIEGGLAHAHFRWLRRRRETLRRWLPIAAGIVLPMQFIVVLSALRRVDLAIDVQARLAIVVATLALAWILWRVLAAGLVWAVRGVTLEPSLARKLVRVLLPLLLLLLAGQALTGHIYTAAVVQRAVLASFGVIVAVALLLGMASRWFLLGERRLALRRAEERRAAAAEAARDAGESVPENPDEAAITLEQVSAHTAGLLRALRWNVLLFAFVFVWWDVLPAIYRLDDISLWTVAETAADGTTVQQPVTLVAVLLGLLVLLLTAVGSRNLPGLIEISLLSRAGVDAASRYAMTSVLRYAIVISGTLIGLNLLGMRWSQLQWMAAALTVGLGFGLQEIFANFVSGLILLFERPFRVGDVITVGELSGRVTRIRTRATTILDFDNKEIVVPNKTFITGQIINWTLSDTTTRLTIKVGVAYGTDPDLVRRLLLRIAAEDPRVLKDPAPACWFLAFGASSLDFELRVFVGTLADRLEVQNALNSRVSQLFAEHGVEIAFPQLDVHVRDLPSPPQPKEET
jgi:potassium efflux system protein